MKSASFRFLLISILLPAFSFSASAAALTLDLGSGLAYHRAHAIPADLPSSSPSRPTPLVLDLRYTTGDADAAVALAAWLKFHAAPRTPVLLLANAATSPDLRAAFAERDRTAGLIVLGVASIGFEPDIALTTEPDSDRRAYVALENGTTLTTLIAPPFEKVRNDEARLVAQRLPERAPTTDVDLEPPLAPTAPSGSLPAVLAAAIPATPPPAPVIDVVLQRAVQLHRTLLALKKL